MENFTPYKKLSKAKKRELDRKRRKGWGDFSLVTRRPDNPRAYKRANHRRQDDAGDFILAL